MRELDLRTRAHAAAIAAVIAFTDLSLNAPQVESVVSDVVSASVAELVVRDRDDLDTRDIRIAHTGTGAAESFKVSNVFVHLGRGLAKVSTSVVTLAGAQALPVWVVPIALLGVLADLWNAAHLHLSERHAAVVWALYDRGVLSPERAVQNAQLLAMVNAHLQAHGGLLMSSGELSNVLDELKQLRCVAERTQRSDAVYWLVETVQVRLGD